MKKTLGMFLLFGGWAAGDTMDFTLPDAQTVTNGEEKWGQTAWEVLNKVGTKDEYGIYAANNGGTSSSMVGKKEGEEGYWSGSSITLAGRNGTQGESAALILGSQLSDRSEYTILSSITLSATIVANTSIDGLEFEFGVGVYNESGGSYIESGVENVVASATSDTSVSITLNMQYNGFCWTKDDKVVVVVNGPAFEPVDGTYIVRFNSVQATYATYEPVQAEIAPGEYPNALKITANGTTNNEGYNNNNNGVSRTVAMKHFASFADGGYMFNYGGLVSTNAETGEGILQTDANGVTSLTLCPRQGAGGSGAVIVLSGDEMEDARVNAITMLIKESGSATVTGDVSLTLAVMHYDGSQWNILQEKEGTITLGEGAIVELNLDEAIENWSKDYKILLVIHNLTKSLTGYNGDPYTFSGIVVTADYEKDNVPEPTTAALSLLAIAGMCARRRRV